MKLKYMLKLILGLSLFAFPAVLMTGCDDGAEDSLEDAADETGDAVEQAGDEVRDAVE